MKRTPHIEAVGDLQRYSAADIDIFTGNIFDLTPAALGPVDAVYDRAALVALPPAVRPAYTAHLRTLSALAPQLVVAYEYDQSAIDGPPFSISAAELTQHYAAHYTLTQLTAHDVPGGMKGKVPAREHVWLLAK